MKGQPPELDATFLGKRGDLGGLSAVPSKAARAVAPVGAEPVPDDGRDGRSHQAVLPPVGHPWEVTMMCDVRCCPAAGGRGWAAGFLFRGRPASE